MTQVAIVKITQNGKDEAVYLDGQYVVSGDPAAGDSLELIDSVATALAKIHGCSVEAVWHAAHEEWQWGEIEADLIKQGKLKPASDPLPVVIDVTSGVVGNVFTHLPVVIRDFDVDDGEEVPCLDGDYFHAGVDVMPEGDSIAPDSLLMKDAVARLSD